MTYKYNDQETPRASHKERRMTSFRFKNETIAKMHFLISEGLAHSMTQLLEGYIGLYFDTYIKTEGVREEDAFNIGFERMYKKTRPMDTVAAKANRKVIREMEIQRAKEQYERMTNTSEEHWDATIKLYGVDTLEEFLIDNGMLEPEWLCENMWTAKMSRKHLNNNI